ncbi:MAG: bi-domain-containing oxidoreductase [Bacteroidota bacterium]
MKQITENLKNGRVRITATPLPLCGPSEIMVRNVVSLISPGTEKLLIELGKKNLAGKAVSRPDLVKLAYAKAKREGFINVFREALARLEEPLPLGYSSAGTIVQVGSKVKGFSPGDAVACSGYGYASHAEFAVVPPDLVVKLKSQTGKPLLSFEEAAFVMLGGIALQGFRCAERTHGESIVVVGLGLIGLLTLQIAHAYGCRAFGVDIDGEKVGLAKKLCGPHSFLLGEGDVEQTILNLTGGEGADAVILTSASKDNAPILFSERIARKRGRIVLVGVADLSLTRKAFWDKELTFTVSKAAGPSGEGTINQHLMPLELVRWTEKRNLEEFVRLAEEKRINLYDLITHRYEIRDAEQAYEMILKGKTRYIGVVIQYPKEADESDTVINEHQKKNTELPSTKHSRNRIGFIGAGMFTRNVFMPVVKRTGLFKFIGVAAKSGLESSHLAETFGFSYSTTDYSVLLNDDSIDSIFITTRHNLHAPIIVDALDAGKNVYVEKPLAISEADLTLIQRAFRKRKQAQLLMVGFNRRYAPLSRKIMAGFENRAIPMQILYRVNAGYIPGDHWTQDREVGGGRIIGEVCHFIDFCQYLTQSVPIEVYATGIGGNMGKYFEHDNVQLSIKFGDGSLATIIYTALGSKLFSRERVEVFSGDSVSVLDDFRVLNIMSGGKKHHKSLWNQDMGYAGELHYFVEAESDKAAELFRSAIYSTRTTFAAMESLATGKPVLIREESR